MNKNNTTYEIGQQFETRTFGVVTITGKTNCFYKFDKVRNSGDAFIFGEIKGGYWKPIVKS